MLKISVITACYNSAETIETTVKSVLSQEGVTVEYILIDGDSTDQTLAVLEPYRSHFAHFISEKDQGIYDALNKGIARASGDIIAILHADDFYASSNILKHVAACFEKNNCASVYGDLHYVDRNDTAKIVRNWKSCAYASDLFLKGWMPPHPAFFLRREYYVTYGSFNTQFKTAADYELMLRMLYRHNIGAVYLPEVLVKMRTGGVSNVSLKNRIRANREDRHAWKINGLKPKLFTLIQKPLSKLSQYFGK
jgi:glycosyltransferase involved in cell wall biosynthesis